MNDVMQIELNDRGLITSIVGAVDETLGRAPESLAGVAISELINPNDLERLSELLQASGHPSHALRLVGTDARSIWVELEKLDNDPGRSAHWTLQATTYASSEPLDAMDLEDPHRHHALVQNSADIVMVVDPEGTVRFANLAMLRLLGLEPGELVGTQVLDIVHPAEHDMLTELVAQVLETPGRTPGFEFRARHVHGNYLWIEARLQNLLDQPKVGGLVGYGRDVTDRHLAQEALESSEERFRSLTSSSPSAIFELDAEAKVRFANGRWVDVTGRDIEDVDDVFGVIHAEDVAGLQESWVDHGARDGLDDRVRVLRPDGETRWVELRTRPVRDSDGQVTAHVGTLHDVTEIELAHQDLEHLATHDSLTNLPNRALLLHRLEQAVTEARRTGDSIALLFVDLDRFKVVNDSLGHHAGDRVLVEVASRLGDLVRPDDVVARFGGDEFVVLCAPVDSTDQAMNLADRIRRKVAGAVDIEGEPVHVSVSVGVVFGSGETNPETMLRDADSAMYAAKTSGRDRAQVFDDAMHQAAMERLTIETGLRQSVEAQDFELHYQPIVELLSSRCVAVEALLRWRHPTRGLIPPEDFLDVAEEAGLLDTLGAWVLETACEHAVTWPTGAEGTPPALFVNLAAVQLADARIVDRVATTIERTGIDPSRVVLEVTERMLMTSPDATALVLHELRELGVRVAIDDFGTGYSSLSYLTKLPVDLLKIDCSFVDGLVDRVADREVTAAIIAMAHALGLQAVAEGVETAEQLEALRDLDCDTVQGFWFSRPVSAAEVPGLLAAWTSPL